MLEVTRQETVTVTMDGEFADKLSRAIARVLDVQRKLPAGEQAWLVNTHTIDHLLAFKMALRKKD